MEKLVNSLEKQLWTKNKTIMVSPISNSEDFKTMVDYLIVTFIREEYETVRNYFLVPNEASASPTIGSTHVISAITKKKQKVKVAIARIGKGNILALENTLDLITEQKPKLVLAVGIAGAPPKSDIFLGDVLLANEILNMTVSAETSKGKEETTVSAYLSPTVKKYVAHLAASDLMEWQQNNIDNRPKVQGIGKTWTRNKEWDKKINEVLDDNKKRTQPKFVDGPIACSGSLIKSHKIMKEKLNINRDILGNDMESVGVAEACQRSDIPLLIVRGISDIVGHERSDEWKMYACKTAASFALELVNINCVDLIQSKSTGGKVKLPDDTKKVIELLNTILYQIGDSETSKTASMCREAFSLFTKLPEELKKQWAPKLFDTLDRPMKYLGDKDLVLKVAKTCITSCCSDETDEIRECEARARICGTSWVYQRTGDLHAAAKEAEKSIKISKAIGSDKNLAFCKKCLGRLNRLRAEEEKDLVIRKALFAKSRDNLEKAIDLFGNLGRYGPESFEVGDCYSLLGRTYLSAGKVDRAWSCATEANRRIDPYSKDYLDLCILKGDILAAKKNYKKAIMEFEKVTSTVDQDYQISEIVARAHFSKATTLKRMNQMEDARAEFKKAREIWEHYKEYDFKAQAEWQILLIDNRFSTRIIKLLEVEESRVRCEAVKIYKKRRLSPNQGAIAQRKNKDKDAIGNDTTVWKNLIKIAEKKIINKSNKD